jgi:uncharacterized protein YukE
VREVRVEPAILADGAGILRELQTALTSAVADIEPETSSAVHGIRGWQSGSALEGLLWRWKDDLGALGGHLDRLADAIDACARDYRFADTASADAFRTITR